MLVVLLVFCAGHLKLEPKKDTFSATLNQNGTLTKCMLLHGQCSVVQCLLELFV